MADALQVNPVALHLGSNHMLTAVGEAAMAFIGHEEGLAEAAPGGIGASQLALAEVTARWEAKHIQHKLKIGGLGYSVATARVSYVTNEDESAQALNSLSE